MDVRCHFRLDLDVPIIVRAGNSIEVELLHTVLTWLRRLRVRPSQVVGALARTVAKMVD
jgi:hypothetical protein